MPISDPNPSGRTNVSQQYHVAVVDEPPDCESTSALIRDLGYRATEVEDGLQALELVKRGGVDVVITELYMPGLDGWELAREVENARPDVHVVALASSVTQQGEQVLTSRHIDGYLIKPVSGRRLEILLRALLWPDNLDRPSDVVLVDVDRACLARLEQVLGDAGVSARPYTDPRKALSDAGADPPDAFITELDLGESDGLDLCQDIRASKEMSRTPIFVLTDEATPDNVARAIRLHVDGFLVKPLVPEVLTRRVLRRLRQGTR